MVKPIKNTLENRVKTEFINYFQQVGNLEMSTSMMPILYVNRCKGVSYDANMLRSVLSVIVKHKEKVERDSNARLVEALETDIYTAILFVDKIQEHFNCFTNS